MGGHVGKRTCSHKRADECAINIEECNLLGRRDEEGIGDSRVIIECCIPPCRDKG
jgi:hypothetical protein